MGYNTVGTAWGFAKQTGFGHRPAAPSGWIPFVTETINKSTELIETPDSESRFTPGQDPMGRISVGGDINTYVEPVNVGHPLYYLLGSGGVSANSPVSGAHTHTFEPAKTLPYFYSETKWGTYTKGEKVYDCMMGGATFEFDDQALMATWNVVAADYSGNQTVTTNITYPTKRKFNFKDITVTITPSGGSAITAKLRGGNIAIDNGVITDNYIQGQQTVQDLTPGLFSINGSLEYLLDDTTSLDSWLAGETYAKVKVSYAGDTVVGSTSYSLSFELPFCWATNPQINQTQNEVISRTVDFAGTYSPTASAPKTFKVTLINDQSTAYSA